MRSPRADVRPAKRRLVESWVPGGVSAGVLEERIASTVTSVLTAMEGRAGWARPANSADAVSRSRTVGLSPTPVPDKEHVGRTQSPLPVVASWLDSEVIDCEAHDLFEGHAARR